MLGRLHVFKEIVFRVVVDLAEQEEATYLGGVPTIWINTAAYLKESGRRLPKVHTVLCGGSAVPRALMESMDSLGLRILHAWGMTETSPLASLCNLRSYQQNLPLEEQFRIMGKQGTVLPGVDFRVVDLETGQEVPWDNQSYGELQVRGPWIAVGARAGPASISKANSVMSSKREAGSTAIARPNATWSQAGRSGRSAEKSKGRLRRGGLVASGLPYGNSPVKARNSVTPSA